MNVKFILGRSGSGKTHYCLEAIRAELSHGAQGHPLILLVPEQATFQMEQALLADDQPAGYHRAQVVSFARLARLVLQQTEPPAAATLSSSAKQMILRRLLQQYRDKLTIFARSADRAGFIAELSRLISELRQYQKTPEQLLEQRQQLLQQDDPHLAGLIDKLADLALIYRAYQDYIADRFIDPDDFLDLLTSRCDRAEILKAAQLWVDGFAGFTPQQYTALKAIVEQVGRAQITLCLDPQSEQFRLADDPTPTEISLEDTDMFHPTLQTYRRLRRLFAADQGYPLEKIILPDEGTPPPAASSAVALPRFGRSSVLAQLEHNLFDTGNVQKIMSKQSLSMPPGPDDIPAKDIVIVETAQRRQEVEAVAAHILRLCRVHNYRFRDIAVILRDFADYQQLLEAAFTDHGIAYFLDQRRSVRHHPLIELLRSVVQVIAGDFKTEHLLSYLKTDLSLLPRWVIDAMENYALSHGVQGRRWYDEKPWHYRGYSRSNRPDNNFESPYQLTADQLNQYRREALAPLLKMRQKLYGGQFQSDRAILVREIAAALVGLLEEIEVRQKLTHWFRQAQQGNDLDIAQTHQQIYTDVVTLLDDLVEALGDVSVTIGQFSEILTAALGQMTLALVPPALDQVLIGAIERSRHPKIKAAFVLGVNEGLFPRRQSPDAFFTDAQREQLAGGGFELAPTSTERLLHERYLAYIALTRPSDFLWVSYSVADEKGTALNKSTLIDNIHAAVDKAPIVRLGETSELSISNIVNLSTLGRQLAVALSTAKHSEQVDDVYQQLYHYALTQSDWTETIQRSLAGVSYLNTAYLDRQIVKQWLSQQLSGSVSRLESFAACPFQHFGRYLLGLQQRDELKLAAVDVGSFYHKALCNIFRKMRQKQQSWRDLTDDKLDQIFDQVTGALIKNDRQVAELLEQSYRNKYLLEEAVARLRRFCRTLRRAGSVGDFLQQQGELEFGDEKELPGLKLELPEGRCFLLHGQIDRVDICQKTEHPDDNTGIMVIDYKSSGRAFPFALFYHGLSLQLISYLLVLQSHYRLEDGRQPQPAAALYLPIRPQGKSHSGPPPAQIIEPDSVDADAEIETLHKAAGIIDGEWAGALDRSVAPKERSKYYSFYVNKDGFVYTPGNRAVVTPQEMSALLDHCRANLVKLADRILKGEIAVSPYRLGQHQSPCPHCEFSALCRFDPNRDNYRHLSHYDKKQVLQRIAK